MLKLVRAVWPWSQVDRSFAPTAPIGPNSSFTGDVNGLSQNATIKTDCIGPIRPGEKGTPWATSSSR